MFDSPSHLIFQYFSFFDLTNPQAHNETYKDVADNAGHNHEDIAGTGDDVWNVAGHDLVQIHGECPMKKRINNAYGKQ